jgi:hypothetical protein
MGMTREDCFCQKKSSDGALSEDWTQVGASKACMGAAAYSADALWTEDMWNTEHVRRLDEILNEFVDTSPDSSVLFSDTPLTRIMQRRQFQGLCLLLAILYTNLTSCWMGRLASNGPLSLPC